MFCFPILLEMTTMHDWHAPSIQRIVQQDMRNTRSIQDTTGCLIFQSKWCLKLDRSTLMYHEKYCSSSFPILIFRCCTVGREGGVESMRYENWISVVGRITKTTHTMLLLIVRWRRIWYMEDLVVSRLWYDRRDMFQTQP